MGQSPMEINMQNKNTTVSKAVINRLPRYYRYLKELLGQNILRISSGELAKLMNVTASQIRQDLNCFGGFGQQGYGYNVKYLYSKIGEILGAEEAYSAVIVGAGNLGRALAQGSTFSSRGVFLKAVFDHNPTLIGQQIGNFEILDSAYLAAYCRENRVDIVVLAVPKSAASAVTTNLRGLSIKGIWNFTGEELNLGAEIPVQNVHLGDLLMTLCYEIHAAEQVSEGTIQKEDSADRHISEAAQ